MLLLKQSVPLLFMIITNYINTYGYNNLTLHFKDVVARAKHTSEILVYKIFIVEDDDVLTTLYDQEICV